MELRYIRNRLDIIERILNREEYREPLIVTNDQVLNKIISMPNELQKSYIALIKNGPMNATEVSIITKRSRAAESHSLNILFKLGHVRKVRKLRSYTFSIT